MSQPPTRLWRAATLTLLKSSAAVIGITIGAICSLIVIGLMISFFDSGDLAAPQPKVLMLRTAPDAQGRARALRSATPVILQVPMRGVIGERGLDRGAFEQIFYQLNNPPHDELNVVGVLLLCDSPGGTVVDSHAIWQTLRRFKTTREVPIYVYVEGRCLSGAIYCATLADKIYSSVDATLGSVGVVMGPLFNVATPLGQLGVQAATLSEGKGKEMGNPFRCWGPEEFKPLEPILQESYSRFVEQVAAARHLEPSFVRDQLGAQIFSASQAKAYGLIDVDDSSREETLEAMVADLGLEEYAVVEFTSPQQLLERLLLGENVMQQWLTKQLPGYLHHLAGPWMLAEHELLQALRVQSP